MPPFRKGLVKRKLNASEQKILTSEEIQQEDAELFPGELRDSGDSSDSEGERADADDVSDGETEGVLFEDDADSTLGCDEGGTSDQSSELADSEEEGTAEEESSDNGSSSSGEEQDSEEESGIGQTHSGSSDDENEAPQPSARQSRSKPVKKDAKGSQSDSANPSQRQAAKRDANGPQSDSIAPPRRPPAKKDNKRSQSASIDALADQIKQTNVTIQPVVQRDEYSSGDSSDEEGRVNPRGAVPAWWYHEYAHVGYDADGKKLMRPPQRDAIDAFLKQCEDPEFWRTVHDPETGQDVVLSKDDLELIQRIRQGQVPNPDHDEYEPWTEWFTREVLATPVRAFPEHKRSFLPSRDEQRHVARIVHALKMGWAKTRRQIADERRRKREKAFYDLWGSTASEETRALQRHIPAPRRPPPPHAESYNPPPEYLLDAKEMKEWNKLSETPWKRKYTFLPTAFQSLRHVPAYERFIRERFLRCLDLYLAPRAIKMRLTIRPEELVPKLPSPRDLQPFPTSEALRFEGHEGLVRSCDFDPSGQYVVSGSDDHTVRVWETATGRCLRTLKMDGPVRRVAWTPAGGLSLVAAAVGNRLLLLNPGHDIGAHRVAERTDELLRDAPVSTVAPDARTAAVAAWPTVSEDEWALGVRAAVTHFRDVTHVAWHARGDYVCVTLADAAARAVVVHQLSRRRSQLPFGRSKGLVQCALFHPLRPLLFVATQRAVRVYDLVKQQLLRKLEPGAQWISALAVHPAGDNLLVASFDRKLLWFDLELSPRPYQALRLHGGAVRSVAFHRRYPLFASAGDDAYIVVSHGMVYNDLLQNPLLVPLKQLAGGQKVSDLCVTELRFHPAQPWLLAACADATLRLYS